MDVACLDGGANYPLVRILYEVYYLFAILRFGKCLANQLHCIGDIEVAKIENPVDFADSLYVILREAVAMKSNGIESYIRNGLACCLYVGRDVLVYESATLKHDVAAEMAELVYEASAAYHGKVIYHHLAGYLAGIAHYDAIAYLAIVCHMVVGHDEAVFANYGLPFGSRAPVDRHTLAESGAVADICKSLFAFKLQILGNTGDYGSGEYPYSGTYAGSGENSNITVNLAVVANLDIVVNVGKIPYFYVIADFSLGMYVIHLIHDCYFGEIIYS